METTSPITTPSDARAQVRNAAPAVSDWLERMMVKLPGLRQFMIDEIRYQMELTSTPGWENGVSDETQTELGPVGAPIKTQPGALPIARQQWLDALYAAATITEAVRHAELPYCEPNTDGSIALNWVPGYQRKEAFAPDGLELTMRASLIGPVYEWTQVVDGVSRKLKSGHVSDVIDSLKAVVAADRAKMAATEAKSA